VCAVAGQENITGESVPVLKRKGSEVISGGQVYDGTLVFSTTTRSSNSTTARIASMAQNAMQKKAKVEGFLSSITRRWSQMLIASTAALFASLLLLGVPLHGQHGALYRALAVLTAGAPCALALVPLAFVCAMSVLSRHGVLVKGSSVLDKLAATSMVVLDKTGTLTEGRLRFVECVELMGQPTAISSDRENAALARAAALSFQGTHPVCDAVLAEYGSRKQKSKHRLPHVVDFKLSPGAGMSGQVDDTWCLFGSEDHVQRDLSFAQRKMLSDAVALSASGKVCSILVTGKRKGVEIHSLDVHSIHIFTFSDVPKWGSGAGVDAIRKMCKGIRVYTGDNAASAADMVKHVGVLESEVTADLSPAQKAGMLAQLQQDGNKVLMVGDGLNDAPALAQADVSAAFASSSESAVAGAADVILLQDAEKGMASFSAPSDMGRVAFVIRVARAVRVNALQSLGIAFMSMICAVVPSVLGLLPLWSAVLLHEGSTVLVALNSCRLLLLRPVVGKHEASM
jgi:Zn2+/Cd2+-exporting ATPase